MNKCKDCGKAVSPSARHCPKCGANLQAKSKTIAILLALFLGGIGVHKFYIGRPLEGILYLLFCWTFLPTVIAIIDIICFLSMNDTKWKLYCK